MYRRRLMDPSSKGLEIVDVEDPWVQIAVPANYVERMEVERVRHQGVVNFHSDLEFSLLIVNSQFLGFSKVSVRIWGQLYQLPVIVPISARCLARPRLLGNQEPPSFRVEQ